MIYDHNPKVAFLFSSFAICTSALAHDVSVEVYTEKAQYVLGEPVLVSAAVTNNSQDPVRLIHHHAPTLKEVQLSIVDFRFGSTADRMTRWADDLRDLVDFAPMAIEPHQKVNVDLIMLFNGENGFFATSPGRYYISGRVVIDANPYIEVLSEPIEIEVLQPSTVADRVNWQWLDMHKEEYGRMVQVPWEAELSDEFLQEARRRCETAQSKYSEYLGLFLSRAYREGPKKDAELSAHFAEIAKARATSERIRSEAEKILRTPRIEPPPAPPPKFVHEVDAATQRAVAEALERFAAAVTGGRMDECAAFLSEDFLRNGVRDRARMLANLEGDLLEHPGVVVSIVVESVLGDLAGDEVEVSGRLVARIPGRQIEEHRTRWVLRREGASWVIRRWDRVSTPGGPPSDP